MEKKLNSLGEEIVDAKDNAKLEASIKRLLSQKPILAFLLKQVVKEFSGFTEDEIMTMIDTISVATIPVDPGSTNNMITGALQESTTTNFVFGFSFEITFSLSARIFFCISCSSFFSRHIEIFARDVEITLLSSLQF